MTVHKCCYRSALERRPAFYVLVPGNLAAGAASSLTLVLLGRTPETPLWLGYRAMVCINGASGSESGLLVGMFHVFAPLTTIPFFLQAGAGDLCAIVAPLICAMISGCVYQVTARRCRRWRQERREWESHEAAQRLQASERERERLARDLHDTVGTALSLVALYSSLAQAVTDKPAQMNQLVSTIRDTARAGLADLRGVLHALPQAPITLQELAGSLALLGERMAAPAGARLTITVQRVKEVVLSGAVRSALVRIFQELVHNALRHGAAKNIEAWLGAHDNVVQLSLTDNGVGFDLAARRSGAGLAGMQSRARELGGSLDILSSPGQGTRVQLQLPIDADDVWS